MLNFDLGALDAWKEVVGGELLAFDLPTAGYRKVDFEVLADGPVRVVAFGPNDRQWLVAVGQGHMTVRFTATVDVAVSVFCDVDTVVQIRTKCETMVVAEYPEETFTSIEPRGGESDEFRRLTHMMRINQEHREALLRGEIAALRNEVVAGRSQVVVGAPEEHDAGEVVEPEGSDDAPS